MYRIFFNDGFAITPKVSTKNNSVRMYKFKIYVDDEGVYIIDKEQKIYLTEENSVIV